MCGIAGWVDFHRNLTDERTIAAAMTETMAPRGPDAGGFWLDHHVALCHRRLAVIDPEGGNQPMVAAGRAVLTYSGEVYNFRELRQSLEAKGHRFRTRSDTEVVLRGYLEWGEGVADRLNGMYAFAVWDVERVQLLLVRDRMGVKPLYYHPLPGGGLVFGSEPKAILAHPLVEPAIDEDGMRELFTIAHTPGQSIYRGMYELRPGHLLRIGPEGLRTRRYWALPAREHADDLDTTVSTVRDLLSDIVRRQLVSDVPLCTLLSGGLDSSVVTALAMKYDDVRSFAVDFQGHAEQFQPDEWRGTPDGPFVKKVVEHLDANHRDILLDPAELADPKLRYRVMRAWEHPQFSGDMNASLYMLFRAIREHSTVALSGESADELFGGYPWFHQPEAVDSPTFPWLVTVMRKQRPEEFFDPGLRDRLDLFSYERDRYQEALAEVPYLPKASPRERRMREICYLNLTRFVNMLLDRKDRLSMAHGLEVRVPFCDHRLVEYVFNTPWSFKTFDGREKSLLRAAGAGLLPATVLERRKSPYPATQDPAYDRALRDSLAEVLASPDAPVRPLLNRAAVSTFLKSPVESVTSTFTRMRVEMVLDLNVWLDSSKVRLDL